MASKRALIAWLLVSRAMAQDCVPGPLSLPLVNVTLSNGKTQRGVSLKVGNPPQEFAFLPKWNNNNTFLYGAPCVSSEDWLTEQGCITFRGGVYEDNKSNSRGTVPASVQLPPDLWSANTYDVFTEKIDLNANDSLNAFPVARPKNISSWATEGYDPMNIMGMAKGSTLINACRTSGRIASDSLGFYWGLDGVLDKDQTKGSFVLGGYDKAKTYGDGRTRPLSDDRTDCPTGMIVIIKDIVLNFANGTDTSLRPKENGGTLLEACIIPENPSFMNLPYNPYSKTLLSAISNGEWLRDRTVGIDYWNIVLNPSKPLFTGDITVVLDDNFQIKIPNHQLIVPERYINNQGDVVTNSSNPVLRINSLQSSTAGTLPVLGRYFLTSAYLFLNRDAKQFTLWKANPTSDENLVAINKHETVPATQRCMMTPTTSLRSDLETSPASNRNGKYDGSDNHSSLSSGVIAGIAVGAATAAGLGIGLLWWYLMHKRKRNAKVERERENAIVAGGQGQPPTSKVNSTEWPSQGYPHFVPQEMASTSTPLAPVELATRTENM